VTYFVDVETNECPVGLISIDTLQLMHAVDSARVVREGGGGTLYGPDASEWPCWYWDAVEVCELARKSEHAAAVKAFNDAAQQR
jgi:hypothetical protein